MTTTPVPARPVPAGAVAGIGGGLGLMSVFTVAWAANTLGAWPGAVGWTVTAVGSLLAASFVAAAVRLVRHARRVRTGAGTTGAPVGSVGSVAGKRPSGRAFGAVFAAEAVAIVVAVNVLQALGLTVYSLPVIALVVGLHFYPMARIFDRRIDTVTATCLSLIAVAGIVVLATTDVDPRQVRGAVAVGAAATTATYGVHMSRIARALVR